MELSDAMQKRIAVGKRWLAKTTDESPAQLAERLKDYERMIDGLLDGLTDAQWTFKPGPDEWSIREVCLHTANAVRAVALLTETLAAGNEGPETVRMSVLDPDEGQSGAAVREQLRRDFQQSERATMRLDREFDTEKTTAHPYFGELNCKEWAVFNLMHLSIHVQQIERIKGAAEYPK